MGKKRDIINQTQHARVDDPTTQVLIASARDAIFKSGLSVGSSRIDDALGEHSLTAVRVC